jgi:hypothetical protein
MSRRTKVIFATIVVALALFAFFVPLFFSAINITCIEPSGSGIGTVDPHYGSIAYVYLGLGGNYFRANNIVGWRYSIERNSPPQHNSTC